MALVWRLLTLRKIVFVLMEPPCGTASRARGIPTGRRFQPEPLRCDADRARVAIANALYDFCWDVASFAQAFSLTYG
jgi:hypothetical protein